jgi:hypothetical protein
VRGVVDALRLGGNDQKRTDAPAPVLAPVHDSLYLRRRDVGEAARDVRRRRRTSERARASLSGGGPRRARAAAGMEVAFWRVRVGGRASGGFAHTFATSTASSSAFDALNTFGVIPRGARRAMHS